MNQSMQQPSDSSLVEALRAVMPSGELLLDDRARTLYAQDVYTRSHSASMVLRPGNCDELVAAVRLLHKAGIAAIPHGGGMSYTSGLVPQDDKTAVIDMGRMDRVLEINSEDMTVTVECGCTWKTLHEALSEYKVRTPFWGTLSGSRATVGGALSQNALFWGSGQHGTAVDSLLSLTVVLGDGTLVETGSAAQVNGSPFFRYFGPDLTGLFCADTGALGFKATATLRLIPEMPAREFVAFDFSRGADTIAAMSEICRQNLASESFAFDPFLQRQRMKRMSLGADIKALKGVIKSAGSVVSGVKEGAKVAMSGRSYMDDVKWSVQVIVEDRIDAGAAARAEAVRAICRENGGREIENSIPKIARANPFGPLNAMLGPEGERWLPVHGLFPHSKIHEAYLRVEELFDASRERSDSLDVTTGYMLAAVSTNVFVLEPVFFWPDELTEIHEDTVEASHLARLPRHPANPEARAHVDALRTQVIELLSELGAVHQQIGKSYRYRSALKPGAARLIDALKAAVDGDGRVNPGSLGL